MDNSSSSTSSIVFLTSSISQHHSTNTSSSSSPSTVKQQENHSNMETPPSPSSDDNNTAAASIDFIGQAENFKSLFKIPYTNNSISMALHRVGSTLVIEKCGDDDDDDNNDKDNDIDTTSSKTIKSKSNSNAVTLTVDQKVQETNTNKTTTCSTEKLYQTSWNYVLQWKVSDFNIVVGSDITVFSTPKHPTPSTLLFQDVRTVDNVSSRLDTYLDNVMANVSTVAICRHLQGKIQEYRLSSTHDLMYKKKKKSEKLFDSKEVMSHAGKILKFLRENCRNDECTYWLHRPRNSRDLNLYDLSSSNTSNSSSTRYRLAIVSYRFAVRGARLCRGGGCGKKTAAANRTRRLLNTCITLLQGLEKEEEDVSSSYKALRASAVELLADTYNSNKKRTNKALVYLKEAIGLNIQVLKEFKVSKLYYFTTQEVLRLQQKYVDLSLSLITDDDHRNTSSIDTALAILKNLLESSFLYYPKTVVEVLQQQQECYIPEEMPPLKDGEHLENSTSTPLSKVHEALGDLMYRLSTEEEEAVQRLIKDDQLLRFFKSFSSSSFFQKSYIEWWKSSNPRSFRNFYSLAAFGAYRDALGRHGGSDNKLQKKIGSISNEIGLQKMEVEMYSAAEAWFLYSSSTFESINSSTNSTVKRNLANCYSKWCFVGSKRKVQKLLKAKALYAEVCDWKSTVKTCTLIAKSILTTNEKSDNVRSTLENARVYYEEALEIYYKEYLDLDCTFLQMQLEIASMYASVLPDSKDGRDSIKHAVQILLNTSGAFEYLQNVSTTNTTSDLNGMKNDVLDLLCHCLLKLCVNNTQNISYKEAYKSLLRKKQDVQNNIVKVLQSIQI